MRAQAVLTYHHQNREQFGRSRHANVDLEGAATKEFGSCWLAYQ